MIELDNVTKVYQLDSGPVHALRGVSLSIDSSDFVAVVGQSGSGKSTMMNILGCLDKPTSGRYTLGGHDVGGLSDDVRSRLRGRHFGFVFQSYNLLPRMSAVEQVELPLVYLGVSNRRRRAMEALARVDLADRYHHWPNQLSGGQQQRVAIARSLVVNPQVVLADEPTGALDTTTGAEVMELLSNLVRERGLIVILVTHEAHIAAYADRTITMRDGQIVDDSAVAEPEGVSS